MKEVKCQSASLNQSTEYLVWDREVSMIDMQDLKDLIRDPLAWAADCEAQVRFDCEPDAKAAFRQLAGEFEAAALEIEGFVDAFEAVSKRHRLRRLPSQPD